MRKTLKWMVLGLLALVIMAAVGGYLMVRSAGHPKIDGDLKLTGLSAPVKVVRDELGVPYITAANTPDLLKAQGFVTAQDRLLQMELFRATWRGELAATFGPDALPSDIRMRVLGMRRNGDRHALKLDAASRAYLQSYADGVNAYVQDHPGDHPIELKAAGLKPSAWSVADLVTLVHFIHYTHSTNFKAEIVGQKLIDKLGLAQAREIMPLTVNPDWGARPAPAGATAKAGGDSLRLGVDWAHLSVAPETLNHQGLGSNNWAIGPSRSASGKAMVVNDPHLDSRILPGYWYPVGLFTPAGVAAAIYYMLHSTVVIAALFLLVELVAAQRGAAADRLTPAVSVREPMLLGLMLLFGAASAAGLPPLPGFLGKLMVLEAASGLPAQPWVWTVVLCVGFAAIVGLARAGVVVFWHLSPEPAQADPGAGSSFKGLSAVGALMGLTLAIAVWASPLMRYAQATAAQLADTAAYAQAVLGLPAGAPSQSTRPYDGSRGAEQPKEVRP